MNKVILIDWSIDWLTEPNMIDSQIHVCKGYTPNQIVFKYFIELVKMFAIWKFPP